VTPLGFTAASIADNPPSGTNANYHAVWARDGALTVIGSLGVKDPDIALCRPLSTRLRYKTPNGRVPACVRIGNRQPDYSGVGVLWCRANVCYVRICERLGDDAEAAAHHQRSQEIKNAILRSFWPSLTRDAGTRGPSFSEMQFSLENVRAQERSVTVGSWIRRIRTDPDYPILAIHPRSRIEGLHSAPRSLPATGALAISGCTLWRNCESSGGKLRSRSPSRRACRRTTSTPRPPSCRR
jgi:hypothetical protein